MMNLSPSGGEFVTFFEQMEEEVKREVTELVRWAVTERVTKEVNERNGLALLRHGYSPDEIADILNMHLDEILKLKNAV